MLPLDCLLAFVFFDANWCGYLHRRDLERVLLTLGIRLSAEQVVSVPTVLLEPFQSSCFLLLPRTHMCGQQVSCCVFCRLSNWSVGWRHRTFASTGVFSTAVPRCWTTGFRKRCSLVGLELCGLREWGLYDGLLSSKVMYVPLGNLDLLPPSGKSTKSGAAPTEHKGLVPHNGSLINVGSLLQRAEQQDSGRLYLENKIHTLELKLGEFRADVTGTKGAPLLRPAAID